MSNTEPQNNGVLTITVENFDTAKYKPVPGIKYEVAPGCIRVLKDAFYEVEKEASSLVAKEDVLSFNVEDESYSPDIRMKVLEVVTEGDELPEGYKGVNLRIVGRAVADFFTFRTGISADHLSLLA